MANKFLKRTGMALLALCLLFVFGYHCPIQTVTGIPCPGCNFTTALVFLARGNVKASLFYHAMVIPTLLVAVASIALARQKNVLTWLWAGWAAAMLLYYVVRMVVVFPQIPMVFDENALLIRLFHLLWP